MNKEGDILLYNLDFLNVGKPFPPESEIERLALYSKNKLLFEGKHEFVYAESFKRIQRVIGNFYEVISYATLTNFQKLITKKIADLLLGEPPTITAPEQDSPEQTAIDEIMINTRLIKTLYMCAMDISRFGDGILNVYQDKDTKAGQIDAICPSLWYQVVDEMNIQHVLYHVLAFRDEENQMLTVQIHSKGYIENRKYKFDRNKISKLLFSEIVNTGLDDFAIIPISNLLTSDRAYGIDDYSDLDAIISEIEVRASQINKILDKHSDPSMSAPASAFQQDMDTGEWVLKAGNCFMSESKEDPQVAYITWDAQLESNFKQIEVLMNFLYTISEMGSAVFGDLTKQSGQVPSGSALKRLMINPLAKVNRIRMNVTPEVQKAIILCSEYGGKNIISLKDTMIAINWQDGLPLDEKETTEIMQIRTGNKPTISQISAIKILDSKDDEAAEEELATINDEEATATPLQTDPFASKNDDIPPDTSPKTFNRTQSTI